ncbi:MAG: DNA polymerase III subunit gamma/tau [Candidatus Moranbacteria bacterium]|nr:DNA polymerase III subunit gamma/tau [Candidatus Moranbacteria bacterium]
MISLYNKYRPKNFADIFAQDFVVKVLKNSVELNKINHAYLFTGPRGTGKTSLARIFAKAANCMDLQKGEPCGKCKNCKLIESGENLDLTEIDAASNTGVDNIRELKENISLTPSVLKYKIYIIDEVHMLSKGAFNALLKSLEEPPGFVIFILATTEIHKIPPTIISRCQRFDFKRISNKEVVKKLKKIVKKEKVKISDDALNQIAIYCEGGMRDAESLLGQIINLSGEEINTKEVRDVLGTPEVLNFYKLMKSIKANDLNQAFEIVTDIVYNGYDMSNFLAGFLDYVRDILVYKVDNDYKKSLEEKITSKNVQNLCAIAGEIEISRLAKIISQLLNANNLMKDSPMPQLPLELALINIIEENSQDQDGKKNQAVKVNKVFASKKLKTKGSLEEKAQNKFTDKEAQDSKKDFITKSADKKLKVEASLAKDNKASGKKQDSQLKDKTNSKINNKSKSKPDFKDESAKNSQKSKTKTSQNNQIEISKIIDSWPEISDKVNAFNRSLGGIFRSIEPLSFKNGVLSMAVKHNFHKSILEEIKTKREIAGIFKEILDLDCQFCYLLENEVPEDLKKKRQNRTLTSQVLEEFGGEIVE